MKNCEELNRSIIELHHLISKNQKLKCIHDFNTQ